MKIIKEIELTEKELGNIEDFEDTESGVIIKSKTGNLKENSQYGK